jgi:hypothetical protein
MSEPYVVSAVSVSPTITTATLPNGTLGADYSAALAATGTAPITWTITSGDLPDGLTLNTAAIYGTPTTAGTFTFTAKAENSLGSDEKEFTVTIGTPPTITTTALNNCYSDGYKYTDVLKATGSLPISWELQSGTLPIGLSLDSKTGTVSGIASSSNNSGTYKFTVKASNSYGSDTREVSVELKGKVESCGGNTGVGTAATFFVSLGAILAPRLRRKK